MSAKSLMFMGTGSDAGKSLIVAGLCRAYTSRGLSVAPFKPQNMSNNAAVTGDGGEIGRAQALQARACRKAPSVLMNPVLLKPEHATGSQLMVLGKRRGSMTARDYFVQRAGLLDEVAAAYDVLANGHDLVLVEGAGSASEVNLRDGDIANFGFARCRGLPVVVIGDISRGGVIASLVGSFEVIAPGDAALVVATMINRFEGDISLFAEGQALIAERTGRPCLGPVPFFADASRLPAEDVLGLVSGARRPDGAYRIAVPRLSRISNFDDLDPLRAENGVDVEIIQPGHPLPRDADMIILAGSKATRAELDFIRAQGWDVDIVAHARAGGHVLGLCGGYQMLGRSVSDPDGIEGTPGESAGLGLLDVTTRISQQKQLSVGHAVWRDGITALRGYHMHMGETSGPDCKRPFAIENGAAEGAISASGKVMGTYLHGLFADDHFRHIFLASLGASGDASLNYDGGIEDALDGLAAHLETHLDLDALLEMAAAPSGDSRS